MNNIYHSMCTMWENKMIEQGFNYRDSTVKEMNDFLQTTVASLKPNEVKKKSKKRNKMNSTQVL